MSNIEYWNLKNVSRQLKLSITIIRSLASINIIRIHIVAKEECITKSDYLFLQTMIQTICSNQEKIDNVENQYAKIYNEVKGQLAELKDIKNKKIYQKDMVLLRSIVDYYHKRTNVCDMQKNAFSLYLKGYSDRIIAEKLGCGIDHARTCRTKARKQFVDFINNVIDKSDDIELYKYMTHSLKEEVERLKIEQDIRDEFIMDLLSKSYNKVNFSKIDTMRLADLNFSAKTYDIISPVVSSIKEFLYISDRRIRNIKGMNGVFYKEILEKKKILLSMVVE